MTNESSAQHPKLDETKRLLARVRIIRGTCELDVLVFLYRHPRTLLTNEQLAGFVGYDMKQVARVIDAFINAGLLERTHNPKHSARMYLLVLNGPQGDGLTELLRLASTRQGRQQILQLLGRQHSQTESQAAPLDIAQEKAKRRLYATA